MFLGGVPTNDTFVDANMMLPMEGGMMGYAYAYDAGTEMIDELCSSIPNPAGYEECDAMGAGMAIGMGEGGIVISNGINGHGDSCRWTATGRTRSPGSLSPRCSRSRPRQRTEPRRGVAGARSPLRARKPASAERVADPAL